MRRHCCVDPTQRPATLAWCSATALGRQSRSPPPPLPVSGSHRRSSPWPCGGSSASGSYRDVEELLAERGIEVDHVSVYR
jgi:hypothetical protein